MDTWMGDLPPHSCSNANGQQALAPQGDAALQALKRDLATLAIMTGGNDYVPALAASLDHLWPIYTGAACTAQVGWQVFALSATSAA